MADLVDQIFGNAGTVGGNDGPSPLIAAVAKPFDENAYDKAVNSLVGSMDSTLDEVSRISMSLCTTVAISLVAFTILIIFVIIIAVGAVGTATALTSPGQGLASVVLILLTAILFLSVVWAIIYYGIIVPQVKKYRYRMTQIAKRKAKVLPREVTHAAQIYVQNNSDVSFA